MSKSTPSQAFLFKKPHVKRSVSAAAKTAIEIAALASALVATKRTRCFHPDGRPENVAEHTLMLAKVAPELARALYPKLDENLVARLATVHDDVEVYVGDTPTDMLATFDPNEKELRESTGLRKLLDEYKDSPSYARAIEIYEAQLLPEARFVRAVDKLLVMLIHLPNKGATLRELYTREEFLLNETKLISRDRYKYGEFDAIVALRHELGCLLADML